MFSMWLNTYIFLGFCCVIYNQLHLSNGNPLIGENVIEGTTSNEFPFIVNLIMNSTHFRMQPFCTGTLIASQFVLTAEHCMAYKNPQDVAIHIEMANTQNPTKYYTNWWITYNGWAFIHQQDTYFQQSDLIIIRLIEHVPNDVAPVTVSPLSREDLNDKEVVIAGWSFTINGQIPHTFDSLVTTVLNNTECERRALHLDTTRFRISERLVCTPVFPGALLSYGDGGCPLLYNNELVGVSYRPFPFHDTEVHSEMVNIYFRIHYYKHFIEHVVVNY